MSLNNILLKYHTDKATRHSYAPVYERFFEPIKNNNLIFLEIGIFNGGSIRAWREYFKNAQIIGVDTKEEYVRKVSDVECTALLCDINDTKLFSDLTKGLVFDIIIDDGSHKLDDQLHALNLLIPRLRSGGLYFIEDLQDIDYVKKFNEFKIELFDLRNLKNRYDDLLLRIEKS